MSLGYSKRASDTPAFALIAEGWNDLVQGGMTPEGDSVCPVGPNDEVIFAKSTDGDIVGVCCWRGDTASGVARLTLFYVEPSSRRRGVFKEMLAAIVMRCRQHDGIYRLEFDVGVANKEAQAVLRHLEAQAQVVRYSL